MKTLRFESDSVSKGHLILVNPFHPFENALSPEQLVPADAGPPSVLLERQAAKMLSGAMGHLGCAGEIIPVSGYRTLEEQQKLYRHSVRENGEVFTRKYVAIPGCSEHQTGLAVDLARNKGGIDLIRPDFPYTGICGRFRAMASGYGFVERYPAGSERITQIAHEPWHFRYVGYPHAVIMQENNLTLEAYTDYIRQFPFKGTHLNFCRNGRRFEIFHAPVSDGRQTAIEIPGNVPCQVSGNNQDGVVVTLWREWS